MASAIQEIERIAESLADGDPIKARALVIGWSAFPVDGGKIISIEKLPWSKVSARWQGAILRNARRAGGKKVAKNQTRMNLVELPGSYNNPENHPEDLPF